MSDPVRVQFFGICTHMEPQASAREPAHWGHRVVLVNASDPSRWADKVPLQGVAAHIATLQIRTQDLRHTGVLPARPWFPITFADSVMVEWRLYGVTLAIAHAEASVPEAEVGPCIPHLRDHCIDLPSAGPATFEHRADWTAAFFDFPSSPYHGEIHNQGAAAGVLAVRTPEEPKLHVTPFNGEDEPLVIHLNYGAVVTVANIPEDTTVDKEHDFYLHFLTAAEFPHGVTTPPRLSPPTCPELHDVNLPRNLGQFSGPGCSNSNYP